MQIDPTHDQGPRRRIALIVIVGLATGLLTQLGQSVLPDGWSQVANAISPWLFVAFLVGSRMPDRAWAAAAGIATLLLAMAGYYAMTELRYGIGGGTSSLIFWGLGAIVGGPVFGIAGHTWRVGPDRPRAIAIGLVAAVAIAEGIYNAVVLSSPAVGAGFIVAGLLAPVVLGHSREARVWGYLATLPALALGAVGYVVFLGVYGVISGV
jgi:hypothetical protein